MVTVSAFSCTLKIMASLCNNHLSDCVATNSLLHEVVGVTFFHLKSKTFQA